MKERARGMVWSRILDEDFQAIPNDLVLPLSGKTVLVTGATGLVGSMLLRYFLYARDINGLNIRLVGVARCEAKARSIFARYYDEIEWLFADLMHDKVEYPDGIDFIIHGAAVTASRTMVERPVDVIDLSVRGTKTMLDLALDKNAMFIYLSSMEVYGNMLSDGPVGEDELGYIDLSNVRSCYPESKRLCENLCVAYGRQFGVDVRIARLAQTFGAGVLPGESRAVVALSKAASMGEQVCLKTRGLSDANYVYASDAVSALITIMLFGTEGETYNVANEECHMTIAEMAQLAVDAVGAPGAEVVFDVDDSNAGGFAADVRLFLNSEKLRALGWVPQVDMPSAMIRLIAYLREASNE